MVLRKKGVGVVLLGREGTGNAKYIDLDIRCMGVEEERDWNVVTWAGKVLRNSKVYRIEYIGFGKSWNTQTRRTVAEIRP